VSEKKGVTKLTYKCFAEMLARDIRVVPDPEAVGSDPLRALHRLGMNDHPTSSVP